MRSSFYVPVDIAGEIPKESAKVLSGVIPRIAGISHQGFNCHMMGWRLMRFCRSISTSWGNNKLTVTCQYRHQGLSFCFDLPVSLGMRVTAKRPAPFFIADNAGLDFLNSIAVPVDTKVEWLSSGEDLLAWIKQAGLAPDEVLNSFRRRSPRGELDAIAAQARALRDWFKPFVYKHMGKPIGPNALRQLDPLNDLLARDEEFSQIVLLNRFDGQHRQGPVTRKASGLTLQRMRRWQSPESLLFPLARSLAQLVATEDFTYVKACEGQACTLLFVDRTASRERKWCSMAVCGNRAKQAAHRKRAQQARRS